MLTQTMTYIGGVINILIIAWVTQVSEILLIIVFLKISILDYSPWESKNRISSKKFMQVEVDLKCMQIIFGGRGIYGSEDIAHFCLPSKRPKFPFGPWAIVHGVKK